MLKTNAMISALIPTEPSPAISGINVLAMIVNHLLTLRERLVSS